MPQSQVQVQHAYAQCAIRGSCIPASLDTVEGAEAFHEYAAAPENAHIFLTGHNEGNDSKEQGMGQLLLAQSAATMRHLQESLHAELDAVQHDCHQREDQRRSAKQGLQEAIPFAMTVCTLT